MLDRQQLKAIMPGADADLWLPHLTKATDDYDTRSPLRIATFLAHVAVESGEMRVLVENLNYSAGRLMEVWPKKFPTAELAAAYAHNPEMLGNLVYANKLGNGPTGSGDGFKFRGHGLLQATGREHYRKASDALKVDLIGHPELLEQPEHAATEAAWWWHGQGLNAIADTGDLKASTLKVNGRLTGYPDRFAYWQRGLRVLGATMPENDRTNLNMRVQAALNARGTRPPLTADGIWGPLSEAAADRFRAEVGLQEVDGIDDALMRALGLAPSAA